MGIISCTMKGGTLHVFMVHFVLSLVGSRHFFFLSLVVYLLIYSFIHLSIYMYFFYSFSAMFV